MIDGRFEYDGTLPIYYNTGGQRIALRRAGVLRYLFNDHLGSTAVTSDAAGNSVAELRYRAFGQTRFALGSTPTSLRFTGQMQTPELGLYDYGARFYDPALGRFIQPDSLVPQLGNPLAWDRYAYANNNPVKYTDPTGHCIFGLDTAACILGGTMLIGAAIGYGLQVAENREDGLDWGDALTSNISGERIFEGAIIAGGVVVGSEIVGSIAVTGMAVLGVAETAACADGDCTNEVQGVTTTVNEIAESADFIDGKTYSPGSFTIRNWSGYPSDSALKPVGPFRLLNDSQYEAARKLANQTNQAIHRANPELKGLAIHEIHPIKFGGSPTDLSNKIALPPEIHAQYTNWWNNIQRMLEDK